MKWIDSLYVYYLLQSTVHLLPLLFYYCISQSGGGRSKINITLVRLQQTSNNLRLHQQLLITILIWLSISNDLIHQYQQVKYERKQMLYFQDEPRTSTQCSITPPQPRRGASANNNCHPCCCCCCHHNKSSYSDTTVPPPPVTNPSLPSSIKQRCEERVRTRIKYFLFKHLLLNRGKISNTVQEWCRNEHLIYTDFLAHNHVDIRKISCL